MAVNIASLVLPTRLDEVAQRREIVVVPIRRPGKQEWASVHPDEPDQAWHFGSVAVLTDRSDLATYVVMPDIVVGLDRSSYDEVVLHAATTTAGAIILWPERLSDRAADGWATSNAEAIAKARRGWVRMAANMAAASYDVHTPVGELAAPAWPEGLTFDKVVELAMKNRVIDSPDHPVLRRLRGDF